MEKSIRIAQILGDKQEYYLGHYCKRSTNHFSTLQGLMLLKRFG